MDAYSRYAITVEENLKGELTKNIECYRHGGYLRDGTLLYPRSDRIENTRDIPQEGKTYIFNPSSYAFFNYSTYYPFTPSP